MTTLGRGALPNPDFWRGKRVVLTGHTGFKGSWLAVWLNRLGAHVRGIGLEPLSNPNLYQEADVVALGEGHIADIRDATIVNRLISDFDPEIVLHLAAQSLVLTGYADPVGTFDANIMGSVNLLEAVRTVKNARVVVVATTDKVYLNEESMYPFRETDSLGGKDPYSASKAATEIVVAAYRESFLAQKGVAVSTARAGNTIGGGDWAANRLIPDAVRAWHANSTLTVRQPNSVRPWHHVLETLTAYLVLAERMWTVPEFATSWNFGPATAETVSVRAIIEAAQKAYGGGKVHWGAALNGPKESHWLSLDSSRARRELNIRSRWTIWEAVEHTLLWYRRQQDGVNARSLCEGDIDRYTSS